MAQVKVRDSEILPVAPCVFEGVSFACPRNSKSYVEYLFGPNSIARQHPAQICAHIDDGISHLLTWLHAGAHSAASQEGLRREDGSRWMATFEMTSPTEMGGIRKRGFTSLKAIQKLFVFGCSLRALLSCLIKSKARATFLIHPIL